MLRKPEGESGPYKQRRLPGASEPKDKRKPLVMNEAIVSEKTIRIERAKILEKSESKE